ncbi:hypothetical protein [Acetobacterium tundrae]|uniref:Uncharacterized protein n=1 Tax=Acetobacterium tundrae TaxID=132932 RepID=A0ABR6WGR8_9FIRM|nr:hypothetical protein [Acetobacterium tundrae]MBC3795678.1 hypothetical protein [Acetobacterium tundrae]
MENELALKRKKIFKTDTKSLIGAVVMGIVFVIACQITGQIDNMLPWGKAGMYLINGSCWAFFTAFITLIYKQPGGIIAAEIEALTSVMYSPLWVAFIFANAVGTIWVSFVASKYDMTKWSHHILAQAGVCILGNCIVTVGMIFILEIPLDVAIIETLILIAVNWIVATVITKLAYDAVLKSGLVK